MSVYSEEHIRVLESFLDHQVKFILIGGHAAIYYGVNRNTGDLDILIEPTPENGKKVISALQKIGLDVPEISPSEFEEKLVLSFGLEPDAVDILNYTPGIEFQSAYNNALEIDFSGLKIRIIDIRDLIANKEHLQRGDEKAHLDKYDVAVLKKILRKSESK